MVNDIHAIDSDGSRADESLTKDMLKLKIDKMRK